MAVVNRLLDEDEVHEAVEEALGGFDFAEYGYDSVASDPEFLTALTDEIVARIFHP